MEKKGGEIFLGKRLRLCKKIGRREPGRSESILAWPSKAALREEDCPSEARAEHKYLRTSMSRMKLNPFSRNHEITSLKFHVHDDVT